MYVANLWQELVDKADAMKTERAGGRDDLIAQSESLRNINNAVLGDTTCVG